jgi:hypothetical protein
MSKETVLKNLNLVKYKIRCSQCHCYIKDEKKPCFLCDCMVFDMPGSDDGVKYPWDAPKTRVELSKLTVFACIK